MSPLPLLPTRPLRPMLAALVTVLGLAAPGSSPLAAKRPRYVDKVWVHPELSRFEPRKIAILPGITFDGDYKAANAVAAGWLTEFDTTGHEWLPADRVRLKLAAASRQRDSLLNAIGGQVQKS